jgi:uncharacterized Tic20 family protein
VNEEASGPSVPPPPGWYEDPQSRAPRWWDGTRWGPVAAPAPPRDAGDNVVFSVIGHLGAVMFPVVLPLVLYLTVGKSDPDVRHHTREALNFQITFLIAWLAGFTIMFATVFTGVAVGTEPPAGLLILFPAMFVVYLAAIGLSILGAVRAGRRRRWRYPVSLRLVGRREPDAGA